MFDIIPIDGGVSAVSGIFCDGVSAGLKGSGKLDVAFIYSEDLCDVEAIFTQNLFRASPIVKFLQDDIKQSNFILINTKNANAMTGQKGLDDVSEILEILKSRFSQIKNPIMSSTGVIGEYLPKEKIVDSFDFFKLDSKNHENAADAIRTTDRFSKEVAFRVDLPNGSFTIGAMAKGAGMIEPNLATMLCFITTDAPIPREDMRELLNECAKESFNAISVDGDTSTNDSVFLLSNKTSKAYDKVAFKTALLMAMKKLAIDIVRDGEGSSKVVAFKIKNAKTSVQAIKCAKALANSLLVKTALFGGDPNWGRIASTIGSCGIEANPKTLKIYIGDFLVYECEKIYFDKVEDSASVMKGEDFSITCDLGFATGCDFVAYGCDLGHKYVEINSDYRS